MSLPYTYTTGYMSDRDNLPDNDVDKLITGALFETVFQGFEDNDNALLLKNNGVWTGNLSSTVGTITLTDGNITLTNGSLNATIDGGTF